MEKLSPILQSCPLFRGIRREDLHTMLSCLGCRQIHVKKGDTVFYEGDTTKSLGVVLTGAVYLVREDYYGSRSILAHIAPTQIFGEAYAFSDAPALPVSVVAEEDSHILLLDSRRVTACCSNACTFHHQLIYNLLQLVATSNLILHQKIQITSQRTTRGKLMAYLVHRAKELGSSSFTISRAGAWTGRMASISTTLFSFATAIISSKSFWQIAMGFSHKTCFFAFRKKMA